MVLTIAGREVHSGLVTPAWWVLLTAAQIVIAWVFLQVIESFSQRPEPERLVSLTQELCLNLFGFAAIPLMLAAPILAMRMLSGEFRDGSYDLLACAPVGNGAILLGKFLGLVCLMTPLGLLPLANLAFLIGTAQLDWGQIAAAGLGLWLSGVFFAAVGLYAASRFEQPGAAVLVAFGILVLFSIIGRAESLAERDLSLFGWLSWNEHLFWFLLGTVRLSDLAYFGLFSLFFLALAHRHLANRRFR